MRYYLIAGEPSGDLHGANLMKGLKAVSYTHLTLPTTERV